MQPVEKKKLGCLAKSFLGIGVLFPLCCLSTFIWPLGYSGKDDAKRSSCMSGVKQVIIGCQIYASDNNDAFSPYYTFEGTQSATKFRNALKPIMKNASEYVYLCPSDPSDPSVWPPISDLNSPRKALPGAMSHVHSYSLQRVIPGYSAGKRVLNVSQIESPESVPYMRDPLLLGADGPYSFHGKGIMIGYLLGT